MAWLWGFMFQRNSFPLMRPSASSSSCRARFLVSLFCRSTLRFSCALFFELLWSSRYLDPRGVRVHFDQRISECNVLTLSHWVSLATQFAPCKRRHRRKNARGARGASGCSHRIHLTQHGQVVGYLALGSAVSAAIVGNHIEKCATRQWFFLWCFHFDSINAGFLAGGFYPQHKEHSCEAWRNSFKADMDYPDCIGTMWKRTWDQE